MITKKTISKLTQIVNNTPNHLLKDIKKAAKKEHLEDTLAYLIEEEYYEKRKGPNGYFIFVYWDNNDYMPNRTIVNLCSDLDDKFGIVYLDSYDKYSKVEME